jgi:hypothetical protein
LAKVGKLRKKVAGYWLLVTGYLLLVAGCWLLVARFVQVQGSKFKVTVELMVAGCL